MESKYLLLFGLLILINNKNVETFNTSIVISNCDVSFYTGQLVRIDVKKFSNCTCKQHQKPYLPSWLLQRKSSASAILLGIPSIYDLKNNTALSNDTLVYQSSTDRLCINLHIQPINSEKPDKDLFHCHIRSPTLAVITLETGLSHLTTLQRIKLWQTLRKQLKGAVGIKILEDVPTFKKSISVLASGLGNSLPSPSNHANKTTWSIAIVWQIGCGNVEMRHLKLLQWIEKISFNGGLSQSLHGVPVQSWKVVDFYGPLSMLVSERTKRRAMEAERRYGTTLLEGSGMPPQSPPSGKPDQQQQPRKNGGNNNQGGTDGSGIDSGSSNNKPIKLTKPSVIRVENKIPKLDLTIRQISNFIVPLKTFLDSQSGYNVKVYAYYLGKTKSTTLPNTKVPPVSMKIASNQSYWISYDSDLKILRFLPTPANIGNHLVRFCAFNSYKKAICDDMAVLVSPPLPLIKNLVFKITAGKYWTYKMETSGWLDKLTYKRMSDLKISVKGDDGLVFCWKPESGEIQIMTESVQSRIFKVHVTVENPIELQKNIVSMTIAVTDVGPISNVISDVFRLRLKWTGTGLYPLSAVPVFLQKLAEALTLSYSSNPPIQASELLVYAVYHRRNFSIIYRDANPDDFLEIGIIYWPTKASTKKYLQTFQYPDTTEYACKLASVKDAESIIQQQRQLTQFYIDSVRRKVLKGVCNHAAAAKKEAMEKARRKKEFKRQQELEKNRATTPRTAGTNLGKKPDFNSSVLIQDFTVYAGRPFYRKLNIAGAINVKLVRFLNIADENMNNLTDKDWIGLSNKRSEIFGLPLKNHVRTKQYTFFVIVNTVTAHRLMRKLKITVESNHWTRYLINHMFKMQLKLFDDYNDSFNDNRAAGTKSIGSLSFRMDLLKTIDRLLNENCYTDKNCGINIILFDIETIQKAVVSVNWSYLPVLNATSLSSPNYANRKCPWTKINNIYQQLNGIKNYPIDTPSLPAFNSRKQMIPSAILSETLKMRKLGSIRKMSFYREGECLKEAPPKPGTNQANGLIKNVTAFVGQGFRVPINYLLKKKITGSKTTVVQLYHNNKVIVSKYHWFAVSHENKFIYGLPLSKDETASAEYKMEIHPQNGRKIQTVFLVTVHPNPFSDQASNMNHEIRMRLEFINYSVTLTKMVMNGLNLRWGIIQALDTSLRQQCSIAISDLNLPDCAWRLDIVLLGINRVPDNNKQLEVRWAVLSILSIPKTRVARNINTINFDQQPCQADSALQRLNSQLFSSEIGRAYPTINRQLEFQMRTIAGLNIKDLKLVRKGPCASNRNPQSSGGNPQLPGNNRNARPVTSNTQKANQNDEDDANQKMFLITTVIPVCAFTICILFVALMIALCMKKRNNSNNNNLNCYGNGAGTTGYMKAQFQNQMQSGAPGSPVILPDEIDRSNYPPSKPLILPHEKPPLPPPDYNIHENNNGNGLHNNNNPLVTMSPLATNHNTGSLLRHSNYHPIPSSSTSSAAMMSSTSFSANPNSYHHHTMMSSGGPVSASNNISATTTRHMNNQTPSILSSPNSHDRFPHGVFG